VSFFDDDEPPVGPDDPEDEYLDEPELDPQPRTEVRRPPPRQVSRRPSRTGAMADRQTLLVRRAVAAGAGLVLLILIVLLINGCLNSQKRTAMRNYSENVTTLVHNADSEVSDPLFQTIVDASAKAQLNVETAINSARQDAQSEVQQAQGFSVPGAMSAAQRYLLLALNLRAEALVKLSGLVSSALAGGNNSDQAYAQISGQMELFLASDVIYSQRVAPLIAQALANGGITDAPPATATRFLPNVGWLVPATVQARISGAANAPGGGAFVPGNHGSQLGTVKIGSTTLGSGINTVTGAGAGVTFTVGVMDSGAFPEFNVKVDVSIARAGSKTIRETKTVLQTTPGNTTNASISFPRPPLNLPTRVKVSIEGVRGENDLANNVGSFLVTFEQ
jgi:hypothetical protein